MHLDREEKSLQLTYQIGAYIEKTTL